MLPLAVELVVLVLLLAVELEVLVVEACHGSHQPSLGLLVQKTGAP